MKGYDKNMRSFTFGTVMIAMLFLSFQSANCSQLNDYEDQYSLEVQALKGPDNTEVTVKLLTSDPEDYPIPEALKKIQIKIRNEDGDVVYIVNEKNAELVNDQVIRIVSEPVPHEELEIKVLVQAGRRVVVLQSNVTVLMRPDLIFTNVLSPETVEVDQNFDLTIDIVEVMGDVGAQADITLFADNTELATISNIAVESASITSLLITSIFFQEPGLKQMRLLISGAEPAEFDETNNEYSFSIEVIDPINFQETTGRLFYSNRWNVNTFNMTWCNSENSYNEAISGAWDSYQFIFTSNGELLEGNLDITATLLVDGVPESIIFENVQGNAMNSMTYYHAVNSQTGWVFSGEIYPEEVTPEYTVPGRNRLFLQQTRGGMRTVLYNYPDGTIYTYEEDLGNYDPHPPGTELEISFLAIGGNVAVGGGGLTATVFESSEPVEGYYSSTYPSYECDNGIFWYASAYFWEQSYADAEQVLDPAILPNSAKGRADFNDVPAEFALNGAYPNPFNPSTTISYEIPDQMVTKLAVFNIRGQKIMTLLNAMTPAGKHTVNWNGQDQLGNPVSTGVYFVRLEAGSFTQTTKVLYIK